MNAVVAPADGSRWRSLAPFPEPTWELEGVEWEGRLLLIGGLTNAWAAKGGWQPNRLVYEYQPASDHWARRASIPLPQHHLALAECDGLIYGFGGYRKPAAGPDAWEPVADSWRYDPRADRWDIIAPLPGPRGAAAACALNGRIYVAGGSVACKRSGEATPRPDAPHASLGDVLAYDPKRDRYEAVAPLLTARNHHLLESVGGRIYALGGRVGSSNAFTLTNRIDLVEEYNPADDTWWPRARMLAAHGGMAAGVHDDTIYVCGGDNLTMIEKYDARADAWSIAAHLPRARLGASGGCVGGRFHVVTGHVRTPEGSTPVADHLALELS
ncbi:MAG: Kelch repeat-containing protein [Burkholderiales bacterium]